MMKKKTIVILVLVAIMLLAITAFSSQASEKVHGPRTVNFRAHYETHPEVVEFVPNEYMILDIPGEGRGTYLGNSTWFADGMRVDLVPPPQPQVSEMVFTAHNGDQMFGNFFGWGRPMDAGGNYYWGGYEISGGTGRFEGVAGSGLYHGRSGVDLHTATFDGKLMFP